MKSITGQCPTTTHIPQDSGTGPDTQATTRIPNDEPMAVIVITVQHDRIQQTARLIMGGTHTASRTWMRTPSAPGSWLSRDLDWWQHEPRLGIELPEYMDGLDLPTWIADMLPKMSHAGQSQTEQPKDPQPYDQGEVQP